LNDISPVVPATKKKRDAGVPKKEKSGKKAHAKEKGGKKYNTNREVLVIQKV
jgi:hypothetical protein